MKPQTLSIIVILLISSALLAQSNPSPADIEKRVNSLFLR